MKNIRILRSWPCKKLTFASLGMLLSVAVPWTVFACQQCGGIDAKDNGFPNYRNCSQQEPHCNTKESGGSQGCDYNPDYGLVHITCDIVDSNGNVTGSSTLDEANCQEFGTAC
jgi:hypothetical protein